MLKVLRKKGVAKKILWFLAVIIILAFGVFGTAYQMDSAAEKKAKYAGKVFGHKIKTAAFENQREETLIVDKINYGNNFMRVKNLLDQDRDQRTWVRIILLKEADKRDIKVSDDEVIAFIEKYPPFQVEGKFNELLYNDILRNFLRVKPRNFEECLRDKLKIDKITHQETSTISVSKDEVETAYQKSNEKVQVSYIFFANEAFKNQVASDESKAKEFYEQHKNDYAVPPMVNVQYVRFDFPSADKTNDKEKSSVKEADKDATWNKAYGVYQELKKSPELIQIAQKEGLKVEESGFFSMEQPNLKAGWSFPMIQKIFEMKVNDFTLPLETEQGYQILYLKESKAASMPDFAQIKDKIIDDWKVTEARKLARAKAEETLKKIHDLNPNLVTTDFAKFAQSLGLEATQTPSFGHGDYIPKLGQAPDFQEKAFALSSDQPLSEVAESDKGFSVLHLDNRTQADMKNFEKEKEKYESSLLIEKKTAAFNDFLTRLRLKANLIVYTPAGTKRD